MQQTQSPFSPKISDPRQDPELKKFIEERATDIVKTYLSATGFTARKITDTPTDNLSVVNRGYVTMNGTTSNRPTGSVLGQSYFDTTLGKPVWWNGTSFVDATGTTV